MEVGKGKKEGGREGGREKKGGRWVGKGGDSGGREERKKGRTEDKEGMAEEREEREDKYDVERRGMCVWEGKEVKKKNGKGRRKGSVTKRRNKEKVISNIVREGMERNRE